MINLQNIRGFVGQHLANSMGNTQAQNNQQGNGNPGKSNTVDAAQEHVDSALPPPAEAPTTPSASVEDLSGQASSVNDWGTNRVAQLKSARKVGSGPIAGAAEGVAADLL